MLKAHLGRKSGESLRIFGQKWISTAVGSVHFSHANPPIFKIFNKGSFLRHFWKVLRETNFDKQFSVTNEITGPATRILWPNLKGTLFYKGTFPSFAGKYWSIVLTQKIPIFKAIIPDLTIFGVFKSYFVF